jgi:uncharacterized membrane protein YphA (DoxX/SURF4 family)
MEAFMLNVSPSRPAGRPLRVSLWIAQALFAAAYVAAGLTKLSTPIAQLSTQMPWTGDVPEVFVRFIGTVDFAAGLGVLLPALTRSAPTLIPFAALGSAVLQVCAMVFHVSRGEPAAISFNLVLLGLSLFVLWGRATKAPIGRRPPRLSARSALIRSAGGQR